MGSAGFPTMPFSFVFSGTFFDMERFFGDVQSFVRVNGKEVDANGRLLSIDGFSLVAGPGGFPQRQGQRRGHRVPADRRRRQHVHRRDRRRGRRARRLRLGLERRRRGRPGADRLGGDP